MTVNRIGAVECEVARAILPPASLTRPRHLRMCDVAILGSGQPIIIGTEAIYGPEHATCFDLEIDYRRTLKAIAETK